MHKSNNDTKGEIHKMFKSVYHGACLYFSPFSGFLECVFTLLWGKHLRGLINGCPRVSVAAIFDNSPPQEWRLPGLSLLSVSCCFLPHFPYCFCTSTFTLTLFFPNRHPWLYCSSFQKLFPQYRVHSWAGNRWTRKPVGHFLVPGIWSPLLLSSSHSWNPAFKNVHISLLYH